MDVFLVGLLIYVFLIFLRMHKLIKKYKINFKYMFLNYVMLFAVLFFNTPLFVDWASEMLNVHDRFEIMGIIMFIYLVYNNFMLEFHVARINQDIETMVSQISIIKNELDEK